MSAKKQDQKAPEAKAPEVKNETIKVKIIKPVSGTYGLSASVQDTVEVERKQGEEMIEKKYAKKA